MGQDIPQEQVWNEIAEQWNNFRKRTPSEVEGFLKGKKGKVLDFGCGSGRNMIVNPEIEYYGVDFSGEMLKIAEKNAKAKKIKAVFLKADIGKEKLPFSSDFFDYAVSISTLHCMETPQGRENAVNELFRVMKKNAEAMITVWERESMVNTWTKQDVLNFDALTAKETFVNWKKDGVNYQRYYYFYDKEELENMLKKAGFKIMPEKASELPHSKKNIVVYVKK